MGPEIGDFKIGYTDLSSFSHRHVVGCFPCTEVSVFACDLCTGACQIQLGLFFNYTVHFFLRVGFFCSPLLSVVT